MQTQEINGERQNDEHHRERYKGHKSVKVKIPFCRCADIGEGEPDEIGCFAEADAEQKYFSEQCAVDLEKVEHEYDRTDCDDDQVLIHCLEMSHAIGWRASPLSQKGKNRSNCLETVLKPLARQKRAGFEGRFLEG